MKGADRTILIALPLLALLAAFWFLVLSPKREEAAKLEDDVATLQASVNEQEQLVTEAEAAKESFPSDYRRLVVLGKAVPENADTSSLLVQLNRLADGTNVDFNSLSLVSEGASAPAPAPPAPATDATAAQQSEAQVASAEAGTTSAPVPATEQAVATQPIGATTGPAGLPVMPYNLSFEGRFFDVTDFIDKLDRQVGLRNDGSPSVFGRLVTIDGFSLTLPDSSTDGSTAVLTDPELTAQFSVTTFLTPPDQGLTAGASPSGPAPAGPEPVSATPSSSAVPSPPTASLSTGEPR